MGIMDWKHWLVILAVVALVFGTKKLKGVGTDIGESIKGFRTAMKDDELNSVPPPTHCEISELPKSPSSSHINLTADASIRAASE